MNAMSFSEMGLSALKRRQFDAAINMLRQALGEDADNLEARFGLARALHEKGSITEALGEYRTVLQSDEGHEDCLHHIARALLQKGDARGALNHVDIILRNKPTDPHFLTLRAQALLELDHPDDALSSLQTAAHHNPGSEDIHRLMAECYRVNEERDGERRAIEQLLRIDPRSMTAANDLAVIDLRDGHPMTAFETYEKILAQVPEHPEATLNRAIALTVMGGMDHQAIWDRVTEVCSDMEALDEIRALADALAKLPDDKRKASPEAEALTARAALAKIAY